MKPKIIIRLVLIAVSISLVYFFYPQISAQAQKLLSSQPQIQKGLSSLQSKINQKPENKPAVLSDQDSNDQNDSQSSNPDSDNENEEDPVLDTSTIKETSNKAQEEIIKFSQEKIEDIKESVSETVSEQFCKVLIEKITQECEGQIEE